VESSDLENITGWARGSFEDLRSARVFLTGGTGFFGKWLLSSLLYANRKFSLGAEVILLTRDSEGFLKNAPWFAEDPALKFHLGDVRWFEFPNEKCTHVIHAATSTIDTDQPFQWLDTIVSGTRRTLEFARNVGARRFLFLSSGAVYGEQPEACEALPEEYMGAPNPLEIHSVYGEGKRMAEHLCCLYHAQFGLQTTIARCFAFVGPGLPLDAHFAIGNFIRDALYADHIQVRGDGSPFRSYLYAADATAWLWTLLTKGVSGHAYNVGSGQALSIAELAQRVSDVLSPGKPVKILGKTILGAKRSRYVPNVQRAWVEFGLDVWTNIETALRKTRDWNQSHPKAVVPRSLVRSSKTFIVDVDGVVASPTQNMDYSQAQPLRANIEAINRLYDAGHKIQMFTARGTMTGIDWRAITERQFQDWGLKYHSLHFGKLAGDYYIDDRMLSMETLHVLASELV